jgi:hypothetical protein
MNLKTISSVSGETMDRSKVMIGDQIDEEGSLVWKIDDNF